jgi:hypothetical protein
MGCAVADERMSDGELRHRFDSIDKRFSSVDGRLDRMATVDMVTSESNHAREKIDEVERDSRERDEGMAKTTDARFKRVEESKQNAWVRVLQVAGIVATIVVGWWTVYVTSKGLK